MSQFFHEDAKHPNDLKLEKVRDTMLPLQSNITERYILKHLTSLLHVTKIALINQDMQCTVTWRNCLSKQPQGNVFMMNLKKVYGSDFDSSLLKTQLCIMESRLKSEKNITFYHYRIPDNPW